MSELDLLGGVVKKGKPGLSMGSAEAKTTREGLEAFERVLREAVGRVLRTETPPNETSKTSRKKGAGKEKGKSSRKLAGGIRAKTGEIVSEGGRKSRTKPDVKTIEGLPSKASSSKKGAVAKGGGAKISGWSPPTKVGASRETTNQPPAKGVPIGEMNAFHPVVSTLVVQTGRQRGSSGKAMPSLEATTEFLDRLHLKGGVLNPKSVESKGTGKESPSIKKGRIGKTGKSSKNKIIPHVKPGVSDPKVSAKQGAGGELAPDEITVPTSEPIAIPIAKGKKSKFKSKRKVRASVAQGNGKKSKRSTARDEIGRTGLPKVKGVQHRLADKPVTKQAGIESNDHQEITQPSAMTQAAIGSRGEVVEVVAASVEKKKAARPSTRKGEISPKLRVHEESKKPEVPIPTRKMKTQVQSREVIHPPPTSGTRAEEEVLAHVSKARKPTETTEPIKGGLRGKSVGKNAEKRGEAIRERGPNRRTEEAVSRKADPKSMGKLGQAGGSKIRIPIASDAAEKRTDTPGKVSARTTPLEIKGADKSTKSNQVPSKGAGPVPAQEPETRPPEIKQGEVLSKSKKPQGHVAGKPLARAANLERNPEPTSQSAKESGGASLKGAAKEALSAEKYPVKNDRAKIKERAVARSASAKEPRLSGDSKPEVNSRMDRMGGEQARPVIAENRGVEKVEPVAPKEAQGSPPEEGLNEKTLQEKDGPRVSAKGQEKRLAPKGSLDRVRGEKDSGQVPKFKETSPPEIARMVSDSEGDNSIEAPGMEDAQTELAAESSGPEKTEEFSDELGKQNSKKGRQKSKGRQSEAKFSQFEVARNDASAVSVETNVSLAAESAGVDTAVGESVTMPASPESQSGSSRFELNMRPSTPAAPMGEVPTEGKQVTAEGRTPLAQFGAGVEKFILKGMNRVKIRLDPADLGAVDVDIKVVDGEVFLSMQTESAAASAELQSQLELLRESLKEQGLNLKEFELGHGAKDAEESKDGKESSRNKSGTGKETKGDKTGAQAAASEPKGITADGRVDMVV